MSDAAFRAALAQIPAGYSEGCFEGRVYRVEKTSYAESRSLKLVAHELGGSDYISLNLYQLAAGDMLRPCEMSAAKVTAFVLGLIPARHHKDDSA